MTRPAPWKVLAFAAALTGLGMVGAGTAMAQTDAPRTNDTSTSRSTDAVRGGSDSAGKAGSDTSTSRFRDGSRMRIGTIHIAR